jgi:hypothetical protein
MSVADQKYFTKEHVNTYTLNASPQLAEQAIHCLELVAELVRSGLKFQFKGGNSLLLILPKPQRFSIDVDIATDETRERIDECVERLVKEFGVFTRMEKRQHKTKPWIPLASYYLYYKSLFPAEAEPNVMLDVQLRRSPYKTEFKPVVCQDIYRSNENVELPVPSSIVGDKLLTMGPNTLGIPVGKGKEAQRLKHVFDVSSILLSRPALEEMRVSLAACLKHENDLQNKTLTVKDIMDDTVAFCATVMPFDEKPTSADSFTGALKENIVGVEPFAGHLFAKGYDWQRLQRDMVRVALCIAAVGTESVTNEQLHSALNHASEIRGTGVLATSFLAQNKDARYGWEILCGWLGRNAAV